MVSRDMGQDKPTEGWLAFLSGNQLAIYTIIAIAVLALIGTILPQRGPGLDEAQYQMLSQADGLKGVAFKLGFNDMFHSIWFYAAMLVLCVNLVLCTTFNFRRVYKSTGLKHVELGEGLVMALDEIRRFKARSMKPEAIAALVVPQRTLEKDGRWFYRESGAAHRYGAIVTHIGIILMVVGAVVGGLTSVDGSMLIPEGERESVIELRQGGQMPLPFAVQCDDFEVEYYPDSRQPKTFRSDLTFLPQSGGPVKTAIEVNHPAAFGGYRFFQSTYGQIPPRVSIEAVRRSDGVSIKLPPIGSQQWVNVEGNVRVSVLDVDSDKFSAGMAANVLETAGGAQPRNFWIFRENPKFDETRSGDYTYILKGVQAGGYYTGLMVTRNAALPVFWFGCAVGGVGLMLAFFVPHRRLLVRWDGEYVTLAYADSRAGDVAKTEADRWESRLRDTVAKGDHA